MSSLILIPLRPVTEGQIVTVTVILYHPTRERTVEFVGRGGRWVKL